MKMVGRSALLPLLLFASLIHTISGAWSSTDDFEVQKSGGKFVHQAKYFYSTEEGHGPKPTQAATGYVACKRGTYQQTGDECVSCAANQYSPSGSTDVDACVDVNTVSRSNWYPFISVGINRAGLSYPAVFNYYQQFVSLPYQATVSSYGANPDVASVASYLDDPHAYVPESPSVNPTYVISHDSVDIHLEATGMWGEVARRTYLDVGACAPQDPGYGTTFTMLEANKAQYTGCVTGKETRVVEAAQVSLLYQVSYNGKKGQIVTQAPVSHNDLSIFLKDLKEGSYGLSVWAVLRKGTGLFVDDVTGSNYTMPDDVKTPYSTEFAWIVKRSKNTATMSASGQCNVLPGPKTTVSTYRSSPFYLAGQNLLETEVQQSSKKVKSMCQVVMLDKQNATIPLSNDYDYSQYLKATYGGGDDPCSYAWRDLADSQGVTKSVDVDLTGNYPTWTSSNYPWSKLWTDLTPGFINMKMVDVLISDSRQQFALPPGCQSWDVVSQLKAFYKATYATGSGYKSPGDGGSPSALAYQQVFGDDQLNAGSDMSGFDLHILYDDASAGSKKIKFSCVGGKYTQTRARDGNNNAVRGIYPLTNVFGRIQLVGDAAMPIVYPTYAHVETAGQGTYNPQFTKKYTPTDSDILTFDAWMAKYGGTAGLGLIEVTPCWDCDKVQTTIAHFLTVAPTSYVGPDWSSGNAQYGTTGGFWSVKAGTRSTLDSNFGDETSDDPIYNAISQIDQAESVPLWIIVDGKLSDTVPSEYSFPTVELEDTDASSGVQHIGNSNTYTARFSCTDKFGSTILSGSDSDCTFYCSVDGKAWYDANNKNATHGEFTCKSPLVIKPVSTGASTLTIRAVDSCGVKGPVTTLRVAADHTAPTVRFQGIPARQTAFPGQEDVLKNQYMDYCISNPDAETCKVRGESQTSLPDPDATPSDKQYKFYDICKTPDAQGRDEYVSIVVVNYREEEGLDADQFNSTLLDAGFAANAIRDPDGAAKTDPVYLAGMDKTATLTIKTKTGETYDISSDLSDRLDVDAYHSETTANTLAAYKDNTLDISISSGRAEYDTVISGNISITVDPNTPDVIKDCSAVLGVRMVNGKYHFGVLSYTNCKTVTLKFQLVNPEYERFCDEGLALGMSCGQGEGYYTTNLALPDFDARGSARAWQNRGFTTASVLLRDLPDADLIVPCDERFPAAA